MKNRRLRRFLLASTLVLGIPVLGSFTVILLKGTGIFDTREAQAQKNFDKREYEQIVARFPDLPICLVARDMLADELIKQGKYDEAIMRFGNTRSAISARKQKAQTLFNERRYTELLDSYSDLPIAQFARDSISRTSLAENWFSESHDGSANQVVNKANASPKTNNAEGNQKIPSERTKSYEYVVSAYDLIGWWKGGGCWDGGTEILRALDDNSFVWRAGSESYEYKGRIDRSFSPIKIEFSQANCNCDFILYSPELITGSCWRNGKSSKLQLEKRQHSSEPWDNNSSKETEHVTKMPVAEVSAYDLAGRWLTDPKTGYVLLITALNNSTFTAKYINYPRPGNFEGSVDSSTSPPTIIVRQRYDSGEIAIFNFKFEGDELRGEVKDYTGRYACIWRRS